LASLLSERIEHRDGISGKVVEAIQCVNVEARFHQVVDLNLTSDVDPVSLASENVRF
jgi:hypothetical protein